MGEIGIMLELILVIISLAYIGTKLDDIIKILKEKK